MGCLLRMSDEIHDWLAELDGADPPTALAVGQALAALMSVGASIGHPLVVPVDDNARSEELMEALDSSYRRRLERLQVTRRRAAEAATLVKDLHDQLAELSSTQARLDDRRRRALQAGTVAEAEEAAGQLAAAQQLTSRVQRLLPQMTEADRQLHERYQRLQTRTDAFRTRKEVLKAAYAAARGELLVDQAIAAPGPARDEAVAAAAARLRDVTGRMERELRRKPWPAGLMELRPGLPAASEVRIIFAVEPPGTALLIAVLEGREVVRDRYTEAVALAADVLRQARAGQAPEAAARGYDDPRSLLEELYPGRVGEVEAAAAALIAGNPARTLAEQRTRLGLTQAEVAQRMGVRQERVSAIERAEPAATEVRTLASYVEALGGRLEIVADFGGERVLLR
jgi:phage shock protein A/DNA-binding XRE family transcriptional regulator